MRIVPLYWIVTLAMGLHKDASATAIVNSLLFRPYFGEKGQIWPVLVQGWTLNYEMFFYVLVGLTLFVPRSKALILLVVTLCSLSLDHLSSATSNDPVLLTYTNPLMLEFLAGIFVAELRLRNVTLGYPAAFVLIIFGIVAFWLPPCIIQPTFTGSCGGGLPVCSSSRTQSRWRQMVE